MHRNRQSQRRQTHEPTANTDDIRERELEALALSKERNEFAEQALKIKTEAQMEIEAEWAAFQAKALSNQTNWNLKVRSTAQKQLQS